MANTLINLGTVAIDQGDYAAARALYEESLTILREIGKMSSIAYALNGLGNVARGQGDYAAARVLYEENLAIRRELGDKGGMVESLEEFARLAAAKQEPERVARLCGAAEALREEINTSLPPNEREKYDRDVAQAREAAYAAAWEEGRAMSWKQAVAYALEESDT